MAYKTEIGICISEIIAHPALADFSPDFIRSHVLSAKFPEPIRYYGAAIQSRTWDEVAAVAYFRTFADKGHSKRAARRAAYHARKGVRLT